MNTKAKAKDDLAGNERKWAGIFSCGNREMVTGVHERGQVGQAVAGTQGLLQLRWEWLDLKQKQLIHGGGKKADREILD